MIVYACTEVQHYVYPGSEYVGIVILTPKRTQGYVQDVKSYTNQLIMMMILMSIQEEHYNYKGQTGLKVGKICQ